MFARSVAIVGTGLIGGSVGLALRARGDAPEISGYDTAAGALEQAVERGAITTPARSLTEAVEQADLVVVAVPVDQIAAVCAEIRAVLRPDAVVTDVASTKAGVVEAGEEQLGGRFVGGHPMAGSERHGIEAAARELFDGAWWILTPTGSTLPQAYTKVAAMAAEVGATAVALDPRTHDTLVARLSHLPQLAASALVDIAASAGDEAALLQLAGGGFRDTTRIAASDPDLWVAIVRANQVAILDSLEGLSGRLESLRRLIAGSQWDEIRSWLERARNARVRLFDKPVYGGEPVALGMMVPDRPGVLAEVTTAAGKLGANIEDLRIAHSTEGGRGRLELIVARGPQLEALVAALRILGYRVEVGQVDVPT